MWVWCDVKSCPVRGGVTFIVDTIRSALDDYGDTLHVATAKGVINHFDIPYSTPPPLELFDAGISLNSQSPPLELFDAEYRTEDIICDMKKWAEESPPDNILLITANTAYRSILDELCRRDFNILLVLDLHRHGPDAGSLVPMANFVWTLESFLKGGPPYIDRPMIEESEPELEQHLTSKLDPVAPGTLILWDTYTCPLPVKYTGLRSNILAALYGEKYFGPATIVAYGIDFSNIRDVSKSDLEAQMRIGVDMIEDLLFSEWLNSPPSNVLIISNDNSSELSCNLDKLHRQHYNILLACHLRSDDDVYENAACVWKLSDLLNRLPPYKNSEEMVHYRHKKALDRNKHRGYPKLRGVKYHAPTTCIWWDTFSCPFPKECKDISYNIRLALKEIDYRGPSQITAYANLCGEKHLNDLTVNVLNPQMKLIHYSPEYIIRRMIKDMKSVALYDDPPVNYLIISAEKALLPTIRRLRQHGFNILVAHGDGESSDDVADFVANASSVWCLSSLLSGEPPYKYTSSEEFLDQPKRACEACGCTCKAMVEPIRPSYQHIVPTTMLTYHRKRARECVD